MTFKKSVLLMCLLCIGGVLGVTASVAQTDLPYPIVDTGQNYCFSDSDVIACGQGFNGQDAQYAGLQPDYQINGDGTVTDLNTGLMWIQDPGPKTTYNEALQTLQSYTFAGYDDWRLPTVKELYSLTLFSGLDPSGLDSSDVEGLVPYIDESVFVFLYGDESGGARVIDSQWLTSSVYQSTVMNNQSCFFGFNFADGRIKCYPLQPGGNNGYFALFVRGNPAYGSNDFVDNGDGTISDNATGLTWAQADSGNSMMWGDALAYCEGLTLGGFDDWRLPNIKALQSIIDYSRSPDITNSPAIDPIFSTTAITNEAGVTDYPYFWSSTTHLSTMNADFASYVAFGRGLGFMDEFGGYIDVHGAGSQRSDPKSGNIADYPSNFGPQGDVRRLLNFARCVRGGVADASNGADPTTFSFLGGNMPAGGAPPQGQDANAQQAGEPPNLEQAAQQLGVTVQELQEALGTERPPDIRAAAERLGVTVEALEQALGINR